MFFYVVALCRYKVLDAAYPWVARRLLTDKSQELRSTLMKLLYRDGKFNFRRMESLLTQAARPAGRAARSSQRLSQDERPGLGQRSTGARGDALALLLNPSGEFVRGIVVQELAKGIDASWRLVTDALIDGTRVELAALSRRPPWSSRARYPSAASAPSSTLLKAVMEVLETVPRLADRDDAYQVDGLRRLGTALRQASGTTQRAGSENRFRFTGTDGMEIGRKGPQRAERDLPGCFSLSGETGDPLAQLIENLEAAAGMLEWAVAEMQMLGPAERAEALRLPLEIGQAVTSRITARVIRSILVGDRLDMKPASSGTSDNGELERDQRRDPAASAV